MSLDDLRQRFEEKLRSGELKVNAGSNGLGTRYGNSLRSGLSTGAGLPAHSIAVVQAKPKTSQSRPDLVALTNAANVWANKSVNAALERARDIRRDKLQAVREFILFLDKDLYDVTPLDVQAWITWLETDRELAATTVYNRCSHLCGFFDWIIAQPELGRFLAGNPVRPAFPKSPTPYQSPLTRSLDDRTLACLWQVMDEVKNTGTLIGLRDYALFLFFAATGGRK